MVKDRYDIQIRWLPFLLRSGIPPEGIPKAPVTPGNPRVNPRMKAVGESVGINFTGATDRTPYTLKAHALLEYAREVDGGSKQNDLAELIFQGYFTDGIYPDTKALVQFAEQVGLDGKEAKNVLSDQSKIDQAHEAAKNASRKGVTGVPCFFMNGQRTFSGAQDVQEFVRVFDIIAKK